MHFPVRFLVAEKQRLILSRRELLSQLRIGIIGVNLLLTPRD